MTPSPAAPTDGPTLLTRLAAKLRGEVPAEALEAFRDAGGAVYPMLPGGGVGGRGPLDRYVRAPDRAGPFVRSGRVGFEVRPA
jgi:hypothetical protein